jgi:hypothetical protein
MMDETSSGAMMNDNSPILTLDQPCDDAVHWVVDKVSQAGLSVISTFDLQVARHAQIVCPCPHHGTDQCDCQMVVLLVYADNREPVTLIAHGYNGQTWFSVVDTPQQRADPHVETTIRQIVAQSLPFSK